MRLFQVFNAMRTLVRIIQLTLLSVLCLLACKPGVSQGQVQETKLTNPKLKKMNENPLFIDFNQIVPFDQLTTDNIQQAVVGCIAEAREALEHIYAISANDRTYANTMLAIDDLHNAMGKVTGPVYLAAYTHPVKELQDQALESIQELDKFGNEMSVDEELYRSVKEFAATDEAKALEGVAKKYFDETLRGFVRSGFELTKDKRDELKALEDKMTEVGTAFNANINNYKDSLVVSQEQIDGLPEDYKKARKQEDGTYSIDLSYPSFRPFMKFSKSEEARKALYIKYMNKAKDENLPVLKELLQLRTQKADLLGYKSYAAYAVEERMAKTPATVWEFEQSLQKKVRAKAEADYAELLAVKRSVLADSSVQKIEPWETSFYNEIMLKEQYSLESEKVKEYFQLSAVLDGLFKVSKALFDLDFVAVEDKQVWHDEVLQYNVLQHGEIMARFYLDLHPRDNKYQHAAMFPVLSGKMTKKGYSFPVVALVCNFPKPTEDKPSLLTHGDVTTMFHEFGHLLHGLLTKAELSAFSGTSVSRDFVEVPSQCFENWAWDYESLKLFAKHYQTGELLPADMHDKMVAAKNVGSGLQTIQQVFYGALDFTLHDGYDPNGPETTTDVLKRLQQEITLFDYVEGTHFEAAFGHLNGYAAAYYGYLWALVYAEEVFSVFKEKGVLSSDLGQKYYETILSKGGTKDEMQLLMDFLGRKPSEEAFIKSLGI